MAKLKALFEFKLHGVGLPKPADFKTSSGISAHIEPGNPVKLSVDIDGVDEVKAQEAASRVASELYKGLLLHLSVNIDYSVRPRLVSSHFSPTAAASSAPKSTVTASFKALAEIAAAATVVISDVAFDALVHEVEVRIANPPKPSSLLDTAIEMYFVGLESPNRVVRGSLCSTAHLL
jgi:hypothetical protein